MHILFLSHYFVPENNAPAARVHAMSREWARLGHRVTVLTCVPNVPAGVPFDGYWSELLNTDAEGRLVETAVRELAVQGHLAAFEAGTNAGAGAGGLAFATPGRGLAVAAAFAAADPLLAMHGTGDVFEFVEFHGSSSGGARLRRTAKPDSD